MPESDAFAPISLEASNLGCVRGGRAVFSGLSFRVSGGEVLAVTGPNGAGKSSLLRLLAGLLRPDAGSIVFGGRTEDEPIAHYLGHGDALKPALTLGETLRFWTVLYQQGRVAVDADWNEAAAAVGIAHALELPVGVLSAGQRRRASLARLILSPRPLWLLDEPTAALDRDGESLLRRLMQRHTWRGGLVVAATHQALPMPANATLTLGAA